MKRHIPNTLTLINLFCGSCAIAALVSDNIHLVLILSAVCLVTDILDGFFARLLQSYSAFGKELDSLADIVSFGVLPGFVVYYLLSSSMGETSGWFPYFAFLIPVAAGYRLAKFNLDTRPGNVFYGLPTPSAMVFVIGILFVVDEGPPVLEEIVTQPVLLYSLIVILPLLMLSDLRLWNIKSLAQRKDRFILAFFISVFLIILFMIGSAAFSLIVLIYVLTGLLNLAIKIY